MCGAVAELVKGLQSAETATRQTAAHDLLLLESLAREAALALCLATADDDATVRESATAALEGLGAAPHAQLQELAALLNDARGDVAYWAATLMGRSEETGAAVADALAQAAVAHPADNVRERAVWALGKIGADTSAVRAALQQAAASDSPRLARLARHALDELPEQ